jgi:asparaginyl-tRNA synthetase
MRRNQERSDLVDNFDLLVPNVGEIVGGSLREHNYKLLLEAMEEQGLNLHDYKEYLETKKYGAMKMGGFGLGLERFVQFLLNIQNIKDTCAFPRSLHNCKM